MKKSPLKRNKPIRRVSAKRAKEMKEYAKLRKEFLELRPVCELWLREHGWIARGTFGYEKPPMRAIYPAEHLLAIGATASVDVHHVFGRYGGNYLRVETWMALSRDAHTRIHENPSWARANGLLK